MTGGAGYIGSVCTALLIEAGHEVTVYDDLSTGHRDAVHPSASFIEGRVHAIADILDNSYDAVLHFAASSLVAESVVKPEKYWDNNVLGAMRLLAAMRSAGVRRLVFSSTAAVYGDAGSEPISEEHPAMPVNPYGDSKLAIDRMIAAECAAHGLGAASLRYFNVGGAYAGFRERHDPETHLIPNLLRGLTTGRSPEIYGTDYPTRDGTCVRDYLHVVDLAQAHIAALQAISGGEHLVVNLGSGDGYTVREVLDAVRRVTGRELQVEEKPRRAGDPPVLVAANQRAADVLGWHPQRGLDDIVTDAWQAANG
ncbi:UDP-glucose 4-epimerase GalE [Epidermidibacterium keratini]|uniref:UDP-glucose 4-epimerase n=1 Tax=Epidermidibacterium keratini TaxID=1891644 RepID=A0A7L4YTQ0_9ACTN|nr:UDP-glucose 4-epimerase GalE [Epidermidibacterium keratini]